jgi:aspartate ammonia-lyase
VRCDTRPKYVDSPILPGRMSQIVCESDGDRVLIAWSMIVAESSSCMAATAGSIGLNALEELKEERYSDSKVTIQLLLA